MKKNIIKMCWNRHIIKHLFWCTKEVNVQHRLRYLLHVIDQGRYPKSMIFMNDVMRASHLKSFKIFKQQNEKNRRNSSVSEDNGYRESKNEDNDDDDDDDDDDKDAMIQRQPSKLGGDTTNDELPVRDIESEFLDILQLLEPDTLRKNMEIYNESMAAKQRKSLESINNFSRRIAIKYDISIIRRRS